MPIGYTKSKLNIELKNLILDFVRENNANPTGIWRDFHCVHRSWRNLKNFVDARLINPSDLPEEPNPSDYPDMDSEVTLTCPEVYCGDCSLMYNCFCGECDSFNFDTGLTGTLTWSELTLIEWSDFTYDQWNLFEL